MMNVKIRNRVKRIFQITMVLACVVTLIPMTSAQRGLEKSNRG